jgi:hypothetical protein
MTPIPTSASRRAWEAPGPSLITLGKMMRKLRLMMTVSSSSPYHLHLPFYENCSLNQNTLLVFVIPGYVQRTLRREKPLPPITWRNFHREINLISTLALTIVSILSLYGALTTLSFNLGMVYYLLLFYRLGHHSWLSSAMGASILQCYPSASIFPRTRWLRRRGG